MHSPYRRSISRALLNASSICRSMSSSVLVDWRTVLGTYIRADGAKVVSEPCRYFSAVSALSRVCILHGVGLLYVKAFELFTRANTRVDVKMLLMDFI